MQVGVTHLHREPFVFKATQGTSREGIRGNTALPSGGCPVPGYDHLRTAPDHRPLFEHLNKPGGGGTEGSQDTGTGDKHQGTSRATGSVTVDIVGECLKWPN